ncbi:NifB/NifX family molybdenum-iron cluster-binding protein [Chloroflexota bacterium]
MRICIPTDTANGISSIVFGHFGSAPFFTIYDDCEDLFVIVKNANKHHEHGSCNPISILSEMKINTVICRGMGARALQNLNNSGIKAFVSNTSTVKDAIEAYENNSLMEMTLQDSCQDHGCH